MSESVSQWLKQLGLSEYASSFAANHIDTQHLPELTNDDLKDLGVKSLGHRKTILSAIRALNAEGLSASVTASVASGQAERRQITVMFCDLVGSTALSERMDPEDYREVLTAFQSTVKEPIERYDGFIARYMGDGLLVYFGYPQAHEEDPERAIRTGLDIIRAVKTMETAEGNKLQVRVGIATGVVVVGDIVGEGTTEERAVSGDTPNLAARLQSVARPNSVLVSKSTKRLVEGRFEVEPETHSLKGIGGSVRAYHVLDVIEGLRFRPTASGTSSPLLGRDEELAILLRRWEMTKSGEGQVVLLGGEPGIGKSRLAMALGERVQTDNHSFLVYQCSPYHVNSAFYPVINQIQQQAGFANDDQPDNKLDKLESVFDVSDIQRELLAILLSLPSTRYTATERTPQKRKSETISLLVQHIETLASDSPVIAVLEDAHWIDHSTQELFGEIANAATGNRILLVVTHRPEFESPWIGIGHVTQIVLNHLARQDVRSLARTVAGDRSLPDQVVQQVVDKTDGVPLFVEELTKTLLESDAYASLELEIPDTIQDSLVARLDRLGESKEIAQIGATIGREFSFQLVEEVCQIDPTILDSHLAQLEDSGLLLRRGSRPDALYAFKHALVRDAAYTTLLRQRRRELHLRVSTAIQQFHTDIAKNQPELLAHHLTEAGEIEAAVDQWLLAGQLAFGRSAAPEAQAHLEQGRALIESTKRVDSNIRRELDICVSLGPVYMTTMGAHAEEVELVYERARQLSNEIGDRRTEFKALWGQWHAKQVSGALDVSTRLAEDCLSFSRRLNDEDCELQAHHASWSTQFFRGYFTPCLEHADWGWAMYDSERHADHRLLYGGHDPAVCSRYFGGMCHWFLGRPEKAAAYAAQSIEVARTIEHPFSLVVTLLYSAYIAWLRQEHQEVCALCEEGLEIGERLGFPTWLPGLAQLHDWALVVGGSDPEALDRMANRVAPEVVAGQLLPANVVMFVDACVRLGESSAGAVAAYDGLKVADALGQQWIIPELHRLHGAVLILNGESNLEETVGKLNLSLKLARHQGARAMELRSATDLARLLVGAGQLAEANQLLLPVYETFSEGFDTQDLRAAKSLLDEIA